MPRKPLTKLCHQHVQQRLHPGDCAVDATVGNGHDTLFLSREVSEQGIVFGFDIQQAALASTRRRLEEAPSPATIELFLASHAHLKDLIPRQYHHKVKVVMFNLGYLPGGDKGIITQSESTLSALNQACELICPGGLITVMVYPGHSGGDVESQAVLEWCTQLERSQFEVAVEHSGAAHGPSLVLINRR